jgi:hypothetical protein
VYNIYKCKDAESGWEFLGQTSNTYYEDTEEEYCTATPPAQCEYEEAVLYKITAVDIGSNESSESAVVRAIVVAGGPPSKANYHSSDRGVVVEYSLGQNYPNPFNPATQITYSLKQDADVTVKVYDMLGTEVANLVNEPKPAGNYEVSFYANNLASGVYIYRITASKNGIVLFTNSKRMLLLK